MLTKMISSIRVFPQNYDQVLKPWQSWLQNLTVSINLNFTFVTILNEHLTDLGRSWMNIWQILTDLERTFDKSWQTLLILNGYMTNLDCTFAKSQQIFSLLQVENAVIVDLDNDKVSFTSQEVSLPPLPKSAVENFKTKWVQETRCVCRVSKKVQG